MPFEALFKPGVWVAEQARRRERQVWRLLALAALLLSVLLYVALVLHNFPLTLGLLGSMLILSRVSQPVMDEAGRWIRGSRSEVFVGEVINQLAGNGFVVAHDLAQEREGNIDHLVSGPTGVYLIETKTRRYETQHLTKAKRQAAKLHDELGVWVTPIICPASRDRREPYKHSGVWIVPPSRIVEWIKAQHNQPLPFERLAPFLQTYVAS